MGLPYSILDGRREQKPLGRGAAGATVSARRRADAPNDAAVRGRADLAQSEEDGLRTARGFAVGFIVGAAVWTVVALLLRLA